MNFLKTVIISLALFFVSLSVLSQETLNEKYDEMIESTETFNQYKVIPRTTLDEFWSEVQDSLQINRITINSLNIQAKTQEDTVKSLTTQRDSAQSKLDESLNRNESISFLGIDFSKTAYHFMVWGIIIVVAVMAIAFYFMFLKSNRVTTRSNKELETLQLAAEKHKSQSRETQVKLKRELQTAINTIEEMKRGRN